MNQPPRIMIGAASSGAGKTTLTCGILQALVNRRMKVASFKCGPDYIDPMFHSKVIGAKSRNLDTFFMGKDTANYLLCKNAEGMELSVIEGVMGYYDGIGGTTTGASSYELAACTQTPVVLTVNCKGMSLSAAALVKGFLDFRPDSQIQGVILNQVTPMMYPMMKALLERELGVEVLGYLPYLKDCAIESRHLGLVTAGEIENLQEKLNLLAEQVEQSVDLERLIQLAHTAPELSAIPPVLPASAGKFRVGCAQDQAFCFYYEDNLSLLQQLGAEIVPFSPLSDKALPENLDGLLLGGGYPELYEQRLSENNSMKADILSAINSGMPCIAECGGFMYLHRFMDGYPMVGAIDADCEKTPRLRRFGYITLTAHRDNLLCREGEQIPAHEFHYWDSTDCGDGFTAEKPVRGTGWDCIHTSPSLFAGYPHLHFYGNPSFAKNFSKKCLEFQMHRMKP